jgi:glycosyltransferase involved in cell wall biosynthesis
MSKRHPFIMLMQRAEDFGYRLADKVVSLLPKAKSYMVEHGLDPSKFVYIPNGVSVADWEQAKEPISENHLNKINDIKQQYDFLLGYAGGMGESNALDFLLTAAKQLDKNIAVVLVGNGANKDALLKRVTDENITNVFVLPAIPKAQIPDFLSRMDALYIGWNKLSIYRFGICPNKLFDYMLSGKPVVHSVSAGNDLVADAKCGVSVEAQDVTAIINAINMIAGDDKVVREELGANGHEYVKIHHDYKVLAKRFLDETI